MNEKYIELAKKLKALSDMGIGGEKINASNMLETLMKKHNISKEDIDRVDISDHYLKVPSNFELFSQIAKSVNSEMKIYGDFHDKDIKKLGLKGNFLIECTTAEFLEVEAKTDMYIKLYEKELEIFYYGFCMANNLLVSSNKTLNDISEIEREKIIRAREMASKIKSEAFLKRIH